MKHRYLLIILVFLLSVENSLSQASDSAVTISSAVDNLFICPDKKEVYLYIDLSASGAAKRVPLNISIVLDRSGSMEEEQRMHNAKIAVEYLINHLNTDDICSIVMYDHVAQVVHGATAVSDKAHLIRKVHHISPGGATNIGMGLQLGYAEVKAAYDPDRINRVILLSDGLANEGITDSYMLELIAKDHSQREGISTSTFGMGHEFNEKLMHNIAEYGGGNYYFVERSDEAIKDFVSEVKMLEGIVAKNGMLKIKYPSSNLKISHVFGFPYTTSKDEINIDLKEVHPKEKHGVLVKFYISNPAVDSLHFTTSLKYINVLSGQPINKAQDIIVKKSDNPDNCMDGVNPDVFNKVVFFSSNYYLDSAADFAEKGDLEKAHSTLNSAKKMHESHIKKGSTDSSLKQQYDLIEEYQGELDKHKDTGHHKFKLLNKKIRHKNYKLKKMTNQCPQP